ncbi:MAG: hypothetical protein A2808_02010 [Candidatus Moranbacteria bacterium RIFCSPHIGHO2_01_FULL_55_24]|nr:MAG: hypothetical protein A2808_02010 [Candidatus Moranbacteria bacterium RIFCSPHIGHO2_01_FULL_55_24]
MFTFGKRKKTLLAILMVGQMFIGSALPAAALFGGIKIPSASKVVSDIEKRYHIDLENVQDQGELFNVLSNKQPAPEVSLFFSPSDPRLGEKISAKAFPVYFINNEESLYYTWYLKRADCGLTNSPSAAVRSACDRNNDNRITVEDWKIEAVRIIAQNGYDNTATSYSSDSDDDGYRARFGGDNRANTPDYCYIHDNSSGKNYELTDSSSDTSFSCPAGTTAVCVIEDEGVEPGEIPEGTLGTSSASDTFVVGNTDECSVSGLPACTTSGTPSCGTGTPRCVANPESNTTSCGTALSTCSTTSSGNADPSCKHLFPKASGATTGDGSFNASEERFWGTDPNDPDTADNGNKDEANVTGLGRSTFTWNYATGDQVGVAVEGTSMIATKHDNSSVMIMWAFAKKDCPVEDTGSYTQSIKNYSVEIETADMDLNNCLERNLVDPAQGGQATNLEVEVSATPNEPVNDETGDESGDLVIAQASVSNGVQDLSSILFDWKVDISNNIQFSSSIGPTADVTADLRSLSLLSNAKGNALDAVRLKLDIPRSASLGGRPLSSYLSGDVGYLRFTSRVSENFSQGIARQGRSDVIVKFTSTQRKIVAYKAEPALVAGKMQVRLPANAGAICNDDALDRNVCRVVENEIVGLSVDENDLTNFNWTINGSPLRCSASAVSPDCTDGQQNAVNFFPVTGNVGDTYTVTLTANDVTNGKTVTLSRSFNIVSPQVRIVSGDENAAWPKFLGQYRDVTGTATDCPGGLCDDVSKNVFEAFSGDSLTLQAKFIPSFLASSAERQWTIDNENVSETSPNELVFPADKAPFMVYNIGLAARVMQSNDTRRALLDIWNISPLDSPEVHFSSGIQIELQDPTLVRGDETPVQKYLAALVSYVPASLLFSFRILLSGALILFATGFVMAILPGGRAAEAIAPSPGRSGRNDW